MKPLVFLFLCLPIGLLAQTPSDPLEAAADAWKTRGDSCYEADSPWKAMEYYQKAIFSYERLQWLFPTETPTYTGKTIGCLILLSYVLEDYIDTLQAADFLELNLPRLEKCPGLDSVAFAEAVLAKAVIYRHLDNYSLSLGNYEKALAIYEKLQLNHPNVAYGYKNAATIYMRRLDYDQTLNYLEKALAGDSTNEYRPSILADIAMTCIFTDAFDKALLYGLQGLDDEDARPRDLARLNRFVGNAYQGLGASEKALPYLKAALALNEDMENWGDAANNYIDLGQWYDEAGNTALASMYFERGIAAARLCFDSKDREFAKILANIGAFFKKQGNLDRAIALFHEAMTQVFPGFDTLDIQVNPPISNTPLESWAMTSAAWKGEALLERYKTKGDLADLANAAQCFDLAIAAHQLLLNTYDSDKARLYLGDYNFGKYEKAVEANYLLWEQKQQPQYLNRVFELMEQSKAVVLREAIDRNKALIFANLPDSLLHLEENFRQDIAERRDQLNGDFDLANPEDSTWVANEKKELQDLEVTYDRLLKQLTSTNPRFRAIAQDSVVFTLARMKSSVQDNTQVLEYFMSDQWVYLFAIQKGNAKLFRVKNDSSFQQKINHYLGYFSESNRISDDPSGFFEASWQAYQTLIPFPLDASQLIIIPDGQLNILPFDALLTQAYNGTDFGSPPFLVQTCAVQYAWSATLLNSPPDSKRHSSWIHFSPVFANGERNLAPLLYGKEETAGFSGFKNYTDKTASAELFQKLTANSYVLHLSTHATAGSEASEPSIEFYDKPLYLSQLYALRIPADLAVLSACETQAGEVARGEGLMSLARGFAYAGARSLIAGFWQVNEQSTAQLFSLFYENIGKKMTKAKALQAAKLAYLKSDLPNARKSPYYWAGFVMVGQDGVLELPARKSWITGILLAMIALVGGIFLWRRRAAKVAALFLLLGLPPILKAENTPDSLLAQLHQAEAAYKAGDFRQSISLYEELVARGFRSPDLYYNAGNAYFRNGQLGWAILYFEKAALLDPSDQDIQHNLDVARSRVVDPIDPLPAFFLTRWWYQWSTLTSPDGWSGFGATLLWLSAAGWIWWLLARTRTRRKIGFVIGVAALLLALIPFALGATRSAILHKSGTAVIVQPQTQLRSAPDSEVDLQTLHEGIKVDILDAIGQWYKVSLPNGDTGWLPKEDMRSI